MNPIHKTLLTAIVALTTVCALPAKAQLIISEVMSSEGTGQTYGADWFELTNTGTTDISTATLLFADSSESGKAETSLRLASGIIGAGQSIVFIEDAAGASNDPMIAAEFESSWFGNNVPANFQIGFYTAGSKGISLSSGGDEVNIYTGTTEDTKIAGVNFGTATAGTSFDNSAGLTVTGNNKDPVISTLSQAGVNGAFLAPSGEIGSPGVFSSGGDA